MAAIDLNKSNHGPPSSQMPAKTGTVAWIGMMKRPGSSHLLRQSQDTNQAMRCRTGRSPSSSSDESDGALLALPLTTPTETDVRSHVS